MATCTSARPKPSSRSSETLETSESLQNLEKCKKEAFKFINEGLDQEDKGNTHNALSCYEKGLRIIDNGIRSHGDCALGLNSSDADKYKDILAKLSRAQKEIIIRLETLRQSQESSKPSVPQSLPAQPSAPPLENTELSIQQEENKFWQDVKELVAVNEGVGLFHVDIKGGVSTWSSTQAALQVFQLLKQNVLEKIPPAFLKCGDWVYPLEPGNSPVLKTQHRTYMFPDVTMNEQTLNPSEIPCVGIVLSDIVPDALVKRFERTLLCYGNFRNDITNEDEVSEKTKPKRPPQPQPQHKKPSSSTEIVPMDTITTATGIQDENHTTQRTWSEKMASGINVGSQWISWGLLKGAEYTGVLVEKGANSLRGRLEPNEEAKTVDADISHNIRQLSQATGSVVQVSAFLVTALGSLTVTLGKKLAPHVSEQGMKLLPVKYRVENNENTQKKMVEAKKIASASLHGLSLMFLALEQAGKNLYQTVSVATVQTVQHKYGEEVGEVTHDAMGAAGNAIKTYWNVSQLGPKAIAKRTLKDTGKAMVMDGPDKETNGNELKKT